MSTKYSTEIMDQAAWVCTAKRILEDRAEYHSWQANMEAHIANIVATVNERNPILVDISQNAAEFN